MISMNHYSYPHDHEMKHSNIDHLIHLEMKQENIMGSGAGGQHHLHHHLHPIHHQGGHMIDHDSSSLIYFNQNRPPIYQSQQELQTQLNNNNTNNEQSSIKLSNETEYNQYNNNTINKSDSLNRVLSMSDSIITFETKLNHLGVENQFSDDDDDDDDDENSSSSNSTSSISSRQSSKNITDNNKSSGNNQTVLNNNNNDNYNSETVNTNTNKKIEETTDNNNSSSPVEKLKMKSDQHIDMKSCVSDVCEEMKMNPVNQTQSSPNSKKTADSDEAVSVYKKFKMNDTQILNMNAKATKQQTEQSEMDTEKNNDSIEMPST